MRIGLFVDELGMSLDAVVEKTREVAEAGFTGAWFAQRHGWDALTTLAIAGRTAPGIELGTSIVPTIPRHPLAMAAQALTIQAATGNRLTLGLGVSHRYIVEDGFGMSFDRPALRMREYLTALGPLLHGESVAYEGETLKAEGGVLAPGAKPPAVLIAALGPAMLRIAGELTDGAIVLWSGPEVIADYFVPTITKAAAGAGRPAPRVVVSPFVAVTDDPDARRTWIAENFGRAAQVPAYRAVMERGGAAGVEDTIVVGDEATVEREIRRLADAGTTDLIPIPFGPEEEQARTIAFLADLAGDARE
ncbi:TIGR03564 family F420-dependent LLM class oxidoreductase [Actinomadura rudentiformis]|uniref:TIGR03564 family F420-dependent LLM class oxidoreductase n=1 Tax=Actinomadura rudentiformis TaxID=359158 RepID=A0A6H9YTA8_9ACTN|nr:TIGR03564 family F420-dependent LLM class oxidoreductase [Actinomadura rudentiformis]KAB2346595.1 TIGR03564 family F420-dependent LLM class oxidoreductase [Actinomadura rudentiformis]